MTSRKRSGSGSKRQFKEKVVQIYETILKGEELGANNPLFWEEFFLLKPKLTVLEAEILKLSLDQIQAAKPNLNQLFYQCITILGDDTSIRAAYGLQTLCGLLYAIFKRLSDNQSDTSLQAIEFLSSFDNYVSHIQKLLDYCQVFLEGQLTN